MGLLTRCCQCSVGWAIIVGVAKGSSPEEDGLRLKKNGERHAHGQGELREVR